MRKFNIELTEKEFEALSIALEKTPYLIDDELPKDWLKSKIVNKKNLLEFSFIKNQDTINIFGENSISHVKSQDDLVYIMRDCDKVILAVGNDDLLEYKDCEIYVNKYYTGEKYICILIAITENGPIELYRWKDEIDVNVNSLGKR